MRTEESFEAAVHQHDARLAALALDLWVGSEPTFTDREAQTPPCCALRSVATRNCVRWLCCLISMQGCRAAWSFVPRCGLHPTLQAQAPLTLTLKHARFATRYVVQLHEWHPAGLAYPGLPISLEDARVRRADRTTVVKQEEPVPPRLDTSESREAPVRPGLSAYCLDLRYASLAGGKRFTASAPAPDTPEMPG